MKIINYSTAVERDDIYSDYISKGFVFIGEKNIVDGNFLIFGTEEDLPQLPIKEAGIDDYLLDIDFRISSIELGL